MDCLGNPFLDPRCCPETIDVYCVRASILDIAPGGSLSGAGTLSGLGGGNHTVMLASIDNEGSIMASGGWKPNAGGLPTLR